MHCLVGCYLDDFDDEETKTELSNEKTNKEPGYLELKINIPPNTSKHLYFETERERQGWKE
jgi:hypothetical protein